MAHGTAAHKRKIENSLCLWRQGWTVVPVFSQEVWLHDGDAGVACVDVSAGVELVMDVAERRLRIPDIRGMS